MLFATSCAPSTELDVDETIRIAIRQPVSLDPVALNDSGSTFVARQIYRRLVSVDPRTMTLKPDLARKWQMFNGGTRFVFFLRSDALFHDGSKVTADDVVFSFNRLMNKDIKSDSAFLFEWVGSVRALPGGAVEILLSYPWVEFPYVLSHPATSIVSRNHGESLKTKPVGSGPYRLIGELRPGEDLLLKGADQKIKQVALLIYESNAFSELEDERVDISEVPLAKAARARARYGVSGFTPLAAGLFLGVNTLKIPDIRIRRALSLIMDRDRLVDEVLAGTLIPADSLVPPVLGGKSACGGLCERQVAIAGDLMREVGPVGPLAVGFLARDAQLFESIKTDAAAVGLNLVGQPQDLATFSSSLVKKEYPLFIFGWVAEYPLADWFLTLLLRGGAPDNHTGFISSDIDTTLQQARAEAVAEKRTALYRDVEGKAIDAMVYVPIGFFTNHYAASKRVSGFYVDAVGGYDVAKLSLDAA
ncbi:MAG: ABC transporter substrate-binding protein [Actinomycetota bacterium]